MAANCPSADTCGICAKGHRTAECNETDPTKSKCANCDTHGNASWDKMCPPYISAADKIEKTDPENTYKYFTDNNPWTWEQHLLTRDTADTSDLLKQANMQADRAQLYPLQQNQSNQWHNQPTQGYGNPHNCNTE